MRILVASSVSTALVPQNNLEVLNSPPSQGRGTVFMVDRPGEGAAQDLGEIGVTLFNFSLAVDLSGLQSVRIPALTTMAAATFVGEAAPIRGLDLNFAASPVGLVKKLALISAA